MSSNILERYGLHTSKGRRNRQSFLLATILLNIISSIFITLNLVIIDSFGFDSFSAKAFGILYLAVMVGICILQFYCNIQRLHDCNRSGWLVLILFIPIVNLFFILYMLFCKGTSGSNKYGNDPLVNPAYDDTILRWGNLESLDNTTKAAQLQ